MATRRSSSTRSHATKSSCPANSSGLSSKTCVRRRPEMIRPKAAPPRLDLLSYESLRQQILRREGWRCQSCGDVES
jgi:hypothetical protein